MEAKVDIRCGDDDLGVNQLPVKGGVLALLVGGGHEGVALVLKPLADAQLVLGRTKELRNLGGGAGKRKRKTRWSAEL